MSLTFKDIDALGEELASLYSRIVAPFAAHTFARVGESSTTADVDLEEAFSEAVVRRWGHEVTVLGEEAVTANCAAQKNGHRTVVVDPIDGTRLFREGRADYACTFAVIEHGHILAGCVYIPQFDERYIAIRNNGLYCNGRQVRPRAQVTERIVALRDRDFLYPASMIADLHGRGVRTVRLESTSRRLIEVAIGRVAGVAKYVGVTNGVARVWGVAAGLVACDGAGVDIWIDRVRRLLVVGASSLSEVMIRGGAHDLMNATLDDAWAALSKGQNRSESLAGADAQLAPKLEHDIAPTRWVRG
jgi:myo-inositol-1(or 4)-monophosphatase